MRASGAAAQSPVATREEAAGDREPSPALRERIVIQLSERNPTEQEAQLRACADLVHVVGSEGVVELVAYGPSVGALVEGGRLAHAAAALARQGVKILVCGQSLQAQGVLSRSLAGGTEVVGSGMEHLVRRQMEGWAYLSP